MESQADDLMPSTPRVSTLLATTIAMREAHRDRYSRERDPIAYDRTRWRAHTFRQLVHLLPGQSILELGSGDGTFTRALTQVSRGENPITSISFSEPAAFDELLASERRFEVIVARDVLDRHTSAELLQHAYALLVEGGHVVFFETNPWNVVLRLRRVVGRLFGRTDPRRLISRPQLYELMSEVGFLRVFAVFSDFVYAPLTRQLVWLLRNLSILLENTPGVRTLAGTIIVYAQKPPRVVERPAVSLCDHDSLRGAVSVVIPCHNEDMNIRPLVTRLRELYGAYLHEIIPVDDNSTDSTRAVMEALAAEDARVKPVFRTPPNGVGRALRDGYRAATGRWVLSMDCDFQHLLPEIRDVFDAAAAGADVVVGSRFSRHSVLLNYPLGKIVANRGFHAIAQLVLRRRFRDVTNNLKLMRQEALSSLELLEPGFAVNAETGLQPIVMGYDVVEVPISWINRTADMGSSSFRLVRVGEGYWRVIRGLWRLARRGDGPYASLANRKKARDS